MTGQQVFMFTVESTVNLKETKRSSTKSFENVKGSMIHKRTALTNIEQHILFKSQLLEES